MCEIDHEGLRSQIAASCTGVVEAKAGKLAPDQHVERMQGLANLIANHPDGLMTLKELQRKI